MSNVFFSSNRKKTCCGSFSLTQNKNKINFPFRLQQARSSLNNEIVYLIPVNFPSTLVPLPSNSTHFILAFTNFREEIVLIVPAPSSNSFEYRILAQEKERETFRTSTQYLNQGFRGISLRIDRSSI